MIWISDKFIRENINYPELIQELKLAFRYPVIQSPPKSLYNYSGADDETQNAFLFMPAWDNKKFLGSKLITTTPSNASIGKPYIQGLYILFDANNGTPLMGMDARLATALRTAAVSALAASYLINKNAGSLLILGNGNLAPFFAKAHLSVHNYKHIHIWGRNYAKSLTLAEDLKTEGIIIKPIKDYRPFLSEVDVISCITASRQPLIEHRDIGIGQHFDLAGSFTPEMQEVSTGVVSGSSVFTDNLDVTPNHAGELAKAFSESKMTVEDIKGDLFFLCSDEQPKRRSPTENTLFKSTGMALEDLVIAKMIFEKYNQNSITK
ncbi:MAG: ornithine cyclodeaminase family protein [Ekhidna sp.]|nr:ornithine cyclodeaminase family protein [Ekhidna sp.]MBC6426508.1 ornithine cyclodeaminase family protein [Ekhidna sp.]